MPTQEHLSIDDFSDHVQEIITDIPHWLVRWGISLFFLVLLLFTLFASVISMPSMITGKVVLVNENPSEEVIVKNSGKLVQLLVKENAVVDSGDILGYIQSTASHKDILTLSAQVDTLVYSLSHDVPVSLAIDRYGNFRHLGEIQPNYEEFIQDLTSYKAFMSNGLYEKKIQSIYNEIGNLTSQGKQLKTQLNLQENNLELMKKDFSAYKELFERKVISAEEYRASESKLINGEIPLQNTQTAISSNSNMVTQKQTELLEIENQIYERRSSFLAGINKFKSQLDNWKMSYVLMANSKGKVVFNTRIYQGQWIDANKPVLYIEQENSGVYFGNLRLGQYSSGKVKKGQTVLLKVDAYPYTEFGLLMGRIEYLPDISYSDSTYIARVSLSRQNLTTYDQKIKLKNGLIATAEVITEKRSLLSKLFDNVYSLFKNRI